MEPPADDLDPSFLKIPEEDISSWVGGKYRQAHKRQTSAFYCGSDVWRWLVRADRLPGRALFIGLIIWRRAARRPDRTTWINLARLGRELGIFPQTLQRALHALEKAGLVSISRQPGKSLRVTLVDLPEANNKQDFN